MSSSSPSAEPKDFQIFSQTKKHLWIQTLKGCPGLLLTLSRDFIQPSDLNYLFINIIIEIMDTVCILIDILYLKNAKNV
jgi:hypothetical protein